MSRWKGEQRGVLERRATGWFGRWREYVDKGGEIKWEQITRKLCGPDATKGEAQQMLSARLAQANGPAAVRQNLATVRQFVEIRYIPDHVSGLAPKTQQGYRWSLEHLILPSIGMHRMRDINAPLLQLWVNTLNRKYSSQTVRTAVVIMRQIFQHAKMLQLWPGELPTAGIRPPKLRRVKESIALTEDQVAAVIGALEGQPRLLVMTLFYTGMRLGEALALDWEHVNMGETPKPLGNERIPGYTIAVRRNWSAGQFKDSPKTPSGRRNIPIHASLWVALMAVKRDDGLLFVGRNGKPLDGHNVANRALKNAANAIGMERLGFHVFRHTFSTLAQAKGMAIGEVRGVLGHVSAATTMIYTHGDIERARAAMEKIGIKVKVN